ncbi:hypothetical protein N431DRAFT_552886 [Stipitochalara longipes BDJ]|nr:hypothetical protein N431DRAFT_552886 [Stipitochalara longipes BDJ]
MDAIRKPPALFWGFVTSAAAAAINITITVPEGTTNHGNKNLLCTPTSWTDIVVFFLGNYVAHAATVPSFHGESWIQPAVDRGHAVLAPGYGLFRGICMLLTLAIFGKSELEVASRAQAIFMVTRGDDWKPQDGDVIPNSLLRLVNVDPENKEKDCESSIVARFRVYEGPWRTNTENDLAIAPMDVLHGPHHLPPGYKLKPVPRGTIIDEIAAEEKTCTIAVETNILQSLVAVGQTLYGISTLYRARGDQISQYGYAAFGLTVTPYIVMSLVNLCATLMCPHYAQVYLVDSNILLEARRRGGKFHGIVGKLREEHSMISTTAGSGMISINGSLAISRNDESSENLKVDFDLAPQSSENYEAQTNSAVIERAVSETIPIKSNEADQADNTIHRPLHRVFRLQTDFLDHPESANITSVSDHTFLVPVCDPYLTANKSKRGYILEKASWNWSDQEWIAQFSGYGMSTVFKSNNAIAAYLSLLLAGIPYVVIAALTKFEKGASTKAQRIWIMTWLCVSQGYMLWSWMERIILMPLLLVLPSLQWTILTEILRIVLFAVPAIGGLVVVAQMLKSYGTCAVLA